MGEKLLADRIYDYIQWHGPVFLREAVAARDSAIYLARNIIDVDEYLGQEHYAIVAKSLIGEINRALRNKDSIVGVCELEDDPVLLAAMRRHASDRSKPMITPPKSQVEVSTIPASAQQLQDLVTHFS